MLLKEEIAKAYWAQQVLRKPDRRLIVRALLKNYKPDPGHIEVITGIRRSGKSTLMRQIMRRYFRKVAIVNFEDARLFGFEMGDFQKLDKVIPENTEAYFFDEIQNVPFWEVYIRQLHDRGKKVFITGSNAALLSKELGTRLTGRHLRYEMFPFSYSEFLIFFKKKSSPASVDQYMMQGGFPEYIRTENQEVLQMLLKDIVLRDIAIRYQIRNTSTLMSITYFLMSNIGKECTYNSLKKSFGLGSANTASDYLAWLEESYLFYFLPRFSWSAKNTAVNPRKVYAVDTGMINTNTLSFSDDKGRLLENAVYMHLRRHPYTLYYFRENKECDFVVMDNRKCKMIIQVCWEIHTDNKLRETEGLLEAMNYFKKNEGWIITFNQQDVMYVQGKSINIIGAADFFTGVLQ